MKKEKKNQELIDEMIKAFKDQNQKLFIKIKNTDRHTLKSNIISKMIKKCFDENIKPNELTKLPPLLLKEMTGVNCLWFINSQYGLLNDYNPFEGEQD